MGEYFLTFHRTVVPSLSELGSSRRLNDEGTTTFQNVIQKHDCSKCYPTTWHNILEDVNLQQHHFDIKSHKFTTVPYNITEYNMH
jgi:hypothetical protein